MNMLEVLEDKVNQLILLTIDLKNQSTKLQIFNEKLKTENEDIKTENAILAHDNAQLSAHIQVIELSMDKGSEKINMLNEEKSLAKLVVDDLIKSIDALVERENQQ